LHPHTLSGDLALVVSHSRQTAPRAGGQALIEMALVVVMLVMLVIGIAEVGWAFMRTSIIAHAARDGARFGATLDTSYRDPVTGCFTGGGESTISDHVDEVLESIGFGGTVAVAQSCKGTVPIVVVRITGTLEMMFNLIGTSFDVDRSVTFEDENRTSCACV
jgi:Flp pilus assembly protein TadG